MYVCTMSIALGDSAVKNLPANAGDKEAVGPISGLGRSPGGSVLGTRSIPVFLPGESHEKRRLVGYSPWYCKESDTTER